MAKKPTRAVGNPTRYLLRRDDDYLRSLFRILPTTRRVLTDAQQQALYALLAYYLHWTHGWALGDIFPQDRLDGPKFRRTAEGRRELAVRLNDWFRSANRPFPKALDKDQMMAAQTVGAAYQLMVGAYRS